MNLLLSAGHRLTPAVFAAMMLASLCACTAPKPAPEPAPTPPQLEPPLPPAAASPPCPPEPPPPAPDTSELQALLAYHQDLRQLGPAELTRELVSLNAQPRTPAQAMRKAMVLGLGRNGADLATAQSLLDGVVAAATPPADALKPLAALLSSRLAEQRRLADSLDKLGQQLRDSQRRNEQLNEKLEALKAIEQRLPASPVPAASAAAPRQP
ncbi:hypothetical protein [Aquabacterium sp.]|uniref:hypothetical protein n=1 Tax=Aquabacterium sp. TaxID=1872578 RepID=UPI002BAC2100|nr:hypothetical protein [Aquabacterium sp.]HSW03666.1 hypothetical protein [Aquabacterium sp.]